MVKRKNNIAADTTDREIVLTRVFEAPRELVWEAWTNPQHLVHWWGPKGFTTTIEKMDVRPGGVWKHVMHGPDGTDYPNYSVFKEVVKPERITFMLGSSPEDSPGTQIEASWTFTAQGEKTEVTIHMVFPSAAVRNMVVKEHDAIEGGKQTLTRFEDYLNKISAQDTVDRDFVITRVFAAPRELVFKAFTDPDRMMQWWGPKGHIVITANMDLRPGGIYHYGLKGPDNTAMWGKFVFSEIVAPTRLVFLNSFSDEAGNITRHPMNPAWPAELLSTITFEEHTGGTLLTIRWALLPSATTEERQTFNTAHSGMQQGWAGTLDQLAAYLAK